MSWGDVPTPEGVGDGSDWGQDPPRNQLRPLNLGDVLDGTYRLLRDHWRAFIVGLGVVVVPTALLSGVARALLLGPQPGLLQMMQDQQAMEEWLLQGPPANASSVVAMTSLTLLLQLLLVPLQYGTATHVAATGYRHGTADAMTGLRAAGRRYWGLLGATLLLGLLPLLIFLLPLVLVGVGFATEFAGLSALGGLGMLVSFVFAVIAWVRIMLTIPALMLERVGPWEALRRSNTLIKGKTGVAFGTILVVGILATVIGYVLTLPFAALGAAFGEGVGAILTTVGEMINTLFTTAVIGAALVLMYFDRRVRKEGYDLTELAQELGDSSDPAW